MVACRVEPWGWGLGGGKCTDLVSAPSFTSDEGQPGHGAALGSSINTSSVEGQPADPAPASQPGTEEEEAPPVDKRRRSLD